MPGRVQSKATLPDLVKGGVWRRKSLGSKEVLEAEDAEVLWADEEVPWMAGSWSWTGSCRLPAGRRDEFGRSCSGEGS